MSLNFAIRNSWSESTVSSQSCFGWLFRASLGAKNIINLILVLAIWWCPCVESSLVMLEEGVCYDQCVPLAKLCPASFCTPRPNLPVTLGISWHLCPYGISALMPESKEELKNRLITLKEENVKVDLKLNIQKLRLWHLVPSLHGKLMTKQWKQWQTLFLGGSKITADSDCSHEMKRCLLLGRKAMTNLDSILKSRDITMPTKVCVVKALVFPVVMYGCDGWTMKKAEHRSSNCLWTVVLEKTLESPLDCKEI